MVKVCSTSSVPIYFLSQWKLRDSQLFIVHRLDQHITGPYYEQMFHNCLGNTSIHGIWRLLKNPAYGRQSISRPMQIVAPIPKNSARKARFAIKKNLFLGSNFTPFISKKFKIWDHFFPLLFSKDSEKLNKFGHLALGRGAKKRLNGANK